MSDSSRSGSSTLLSSPDGRQQRDSMGDLNRDVPVRLSSFSTNVKWCKGLLGPALAVNMGLEIAQVVMTPTEAKHHWSRFERMAYQQEKIANYAGVAVTCILFLLYFASLIFPISRPKTPWEPIRNQSLHRSLCTQGFILMALLLVTHALPHILYIIFTHLPSPDFYPIIIPKAPWLSISVLRNATLVLSIIIVGSMRRGPMMKFTPMKLGTGFGVNAEKDDAKVLDKPLTAAELADLETQGKAHGVDDGQSNVLDYLNSAMLDFILLSYIAPLAKVSILKPRLLMSDLPHLEQFVRDAGQGQVVTRRKSGRIALDDPGEEVTRWQLIKAVWGDKGWSIFLTLIFESLIVIVGFLQVVSLYEIINSVGDTRNTSKAYPYLMCWGLFLGQLTEVFLQAYTWTRENYLLHNPVRFSMASILFTKILRSADAKSKEAHNLKDGETARKGRSQVVNLLSIDSGTIADESNVSTPRDDADCALTASHTCLGYQQRYNLTCVDVLAISKPVLAIKKSFVAEWRKSVTVGVYILYGMFGVSAFIGIAIVPLSGPFNLWVARACYRTDRSWAQARDARTSGIKEFLLGYKVIKLNGFEPFFKRRIELLREVETKHQRWRYTLGTLFNILADQMPSFAIALTFLSYTKFFGQPLVPSKAYVAINVFNRVKVALQAVPNIMQSLFESLVAIDRIRRFLNSPDIQPLQDDDPEALVFLNATVGWPQGVDADVDKAKLFKLQDIDVKIPKGKFTLISGPLGSGKTLLLRSLLGEGIVEKGYVSAPQSLPSATPLNGSGMGTKWTLDTWLDNSVAYAPQQAYIRHGTIRDNITFGQPMWRARYDEALRQAALVGDLALMPEGDLTEVGDQGVTLSGGQRARVNLARCLYSPAKTVYMDDILSAVDAHTAQFLFSECLTGTLFKDRTVVFVTHHVALCLPGADYIITLDNGRVEQACPAYAAQVDNLQALEEERHIDEPAVDAKRAPEPVPGDSPKAAAPAGEHVVSRQIYTTEHSGEGRVARSHYLLVFASAGGWGYWLGIFILYVGTALFDVLKPVFMRGWSSDPLPEHLNHYLKGWFGLITATILLGAFRWVWLYGMRTPLGIVGFYSRGSKLVHKQLLDKIIGAPMSFFESTPAGRLLNLCSQDVYKLDAQVADAFGRTVAAVLGVGLAFLVSCYESPPLIIIAIGFGIPLQWLSSRLAKLRADLRRLCAIADSPLISLYNDASSGIVMIRAFGSHEFMMASMGALFERDRQAWCADWQVFNWVRSTIRAMSCVFVASAAFLMVYSGSTSAQVGLVLTFAGSASGGLFQLLEQVSNLEQVLVSAERINHYIEDTEQESSEGEKAEKGWPKQGAVEFKDMSVRYDEDLPEVLKKISFKVEPGMRVGLVGATGSGKSTLALTLFRAIEPHQGSIEIDGVDIRGLELHSLRQSLNMVVQDGSLNSGTLRDALDVTGLKDDLEIYEALQRVHLVPAVVTPEDVEINPFCNLDTFVAVEGANFSQGQRQLLCLARALLKHSKVLVMDEATSSVDFEMDALITQTIRTEFKGTTIISIAHRLATIMAYDRVLVLDKGAILEYDSPLNLIRKEDSAFHGLCMAQGEEEFEKLKKMAEE